jgi:thioredoxin 1
MRHLHLNFGEIMLFIILVIGINVPIILMEHNNDIHEIHFKEVRLEDACSKAKSENKPIFLEIGTSWCFSCHRIRKQIYTRKDVGTFFNEHFVNISMDKCSYEAAIWIELLQPTKFPLLVIIDSAGNSKFSTQGFLRAEDLLEFGKSGLNKIHIDELKTRVNEMNVDREQPFSCCHRKGTAACNYPSPIGLASGIKDRVAFWRCVKIVD